MSEQGEYLPAHRATMTDREAQWLAGVKQNPWVEYRCHASGQRSHLLATVHPIGLVPPMLTRPVVPGVQPVQRIELAVWLRAGTVTREVAERLSWSVPASAGPRFVLAESACIFSLSGNEPPPSDWWVVCSDTVAMLSMGTLWYAGLSVAWRNQADTPVRLFANRPA